MTEYDDDFDGDEPEDDAPVQRDRNPLRPQLRKMEKELRALREEATAGKQAVRDLEFAKAGVPLDDPKAKWFLKGYDGDLTAEAIKAAAADAGILAPAVAADDIPADEKAAHLRIAESAAGVAPPGGRDFAAELAAARLLPATEGKAAVAKIAREAGMNVTSG